MNTGNHTVQINKQITIKVTTISGGPIELHQWKIDNIIQSNNTDTLIIPSNTLTIGNHTIGFKGQNYCGSYSDELIENINIIEATNMTYIQTDQLNVNQQTVSTTIKLRRTSIVTVTVTDEVDIPLSSAQVSIAGISGTTNESGVITLSLIPYGAQTVTTTIP